jgi:hypothetical protein
VSEPRKRDHGGADLVENARVGVDNPMNETLYAVYESSGPENDSIAPDACGAIHCSLDTSTAALQCAEGCVDGRFKIFDSLRRVFPFD